MYIYFAGLQVVVQPDKLKVVDQGIATFFCESNAINPKTDWRRNGRYLTVNAKSSYKVFSTWGGSVLRIHPVRLHRDNTMFECIVHNKDDPDAEPVSAMGQVMVYPKGLRK